MTAIMCNACAGEVDPDEADLWVVTQWNGPRQGCSADCARRLYGALRPPEWTPHDQLWPAASRHEALNGLFGYPSDPPTVPGAQRGAEEDAA